MSGSESEKSFSEEEEEEEFEEYDRPKKRSRVSNFIIDEAGTFMIQF